MGRIINCQFIMPVTNQSYTDVRPLIEGENWEDIKEVATNIARSIGNEKLAATLDNNKVGFEKIVTQQGDLYFNKDEHTYEDKDGNKFWTGSTWAHQFVKDFDPQFVAQKVADKKLTTVDNVLEGWDMKGEVSLLYGTTLHKALECGIKYNELPNNPHLATLVQDYLDMTHEDEQVSEQFVCSFEDRMCGTIDVLVNKGNKHVVIRDFKTGDIYKKVQLTEQAKEFWPDLKAQMISVYQLQLSFYAYILTKLGYRPEALELWAESAEAWEVVKLSTLDIRKALQAV